MKPFKRWLKENRGIEMPEGDIDGAWFAQHNLPMVVRCSCCDMTMASPNAFVDNAGYTYCSGCKGED